MSLALTERERMKLALVINARSVISELWNFYSHGDAEPDVLFDSERASEGFWFDWDKIQNHCLPEVGLVMSASRRTAQDQYTYPAYAVVFRTGDWFPMGTVDQMDDIRHLAEVDDRSVMVNDAMDIVRQTCLSVPSDRRNEAMKHLDALRRILKPVL
jgi:hypothetical protein